MTEEGRGGKRAKRHGLRGFFDKLMTVRLFCKVILWKLLIFNRTAGIDAFRLI